jgi:uncharacterized membrane protein
MTGTRHTDALYRAKQPKTILAGPYGHPFHPLLVTIPIGTWIASAVFDIVALASDEKEAAFAEGAYWLIGIGILGAVLAALFGLMDLLAIPRGTKAFRTGLMHMTLNLAVVVLFVIDFAIRASQGPRRPAPWASSSAWWRWPCSASQEGSAASSLITTASASPARRPRAKASADQLTTSNPITAG